MAEKFQYSREWTDEKAFPMLSFSKSWENPEDYPTYEPDETQVRKDMQSLHDEVKDYLNDILIPAVLAEDATEEARSAAETARQEAEQERVTAEQERVSAEEARVAAEEARASAESARQSAETARDSEESVRQRQEAARQTAETERDSAETARAQAEQGRSTAETARANAETARREAETSRATAESNRAAAEQGRTSAENTRVQNETKRVSAEEARAAAETARQEAEQARADENTGIVARATAQANSAAGSAQTAQTAASSAAAKASDAAASQEAAAASKTTAKASEEAAAGSAAAAEASKTAAAGSEAAAASSAAEAVGHNKAAQSWAVGGTGTREGEDTNNAKYWAEQAEATVGGDFATKPEAQGYVTDHNQSTTAHSDIREALRNSVRYDTAQSLSTAQKERARNNIGALAVDGAIDGLNIQGGIKSIGSFGHSVAINPAINGAGYSRKKGAIIKLFYDDYEMPYATNAIDTLFDGKAGTYVNFPSGASGGYGWDSSKVYPAGAYVTAGTPKCWYKALKENTGVNPVGDETGAWSFASMSETGSYTSLIDMTDVNVILDITFPSSIRYENSVSLYWRAESQNARYVKLEKYDSNAGWYTVYEQDQISKNEVITNAYIGLSVSGAGTQNRLRITLKSQPGSAWLALTQIAITGLYGGIEGTLLNRGGDTVFGNITPNSAGGASLGTASLPWGEVRAQRLYGDSSEETAKFTQAESRSSIATGEKISVLFGKISKWFSDLKGLAFKDKVGKDDLDSAVQSSLLLAVSASDNGKFLRVADGSWVAEQSIIYSTEDLTAGESPLADGVLYVVYE